MNQDSTRDKMDVSFYCSQHPRQKLTFSSRASKVNAKSAYEINVEIIVHPCVQCKNEMDRIKNAVSILTSLNKTE